MAKNDSRNEDKHEEVDGIKYYPSHEEFLRVIQELTPNDSDGSNEEE